MLVVGVVGGCWCWLLVLVVGVVGGCWRLLVLVVGVVGGCRCWLVLLEVVGPKTDVQAQEELREF